MITIPTTIIPIGKVVKNKGQIEGLPANPRDIKDDKFQKLKKSIEENPEMLAYRELLVYPYEGNYIVIGGNMRLAAMKELGYKEVPVKIIPEATTIQALKAYTIKDNAGFGEWDWDMLANEWDNQELIDWGVDVWNPNSGDVNIDDLSLENPVAEKDSNLKIEVILPNTMADVMDEIRGVIEEALADYPQATVK